MYILGVIVAVAEDKSSKRLQDERRRIQAQIRLRNARQQRSQIFYDVFASGEINLSHFFVVATICMALGYIAASFFFESDIIMMPNSSKRFRGLDLDKVFDIDNIANETNTTSPPMPEITPDNIQQRIHESPPIDASSQETKESISRNSLDSSRHSNKKEKVEHQQQYNEHLVQDSNDSPLPLSKIRMPDINKETIVDTKQHNMQDKYETNSDIRNSVSSNQAHFDNSDDTFTRANQQRQQAYSGSNNEQEPLRQTVQERQQSRLKRTFHQQNRETQWTTLQQQSQQQHQAIPIMPDDIKSVDEGILHSSSHSETFDQHPTGGTFTATRPVSELTIEFARHGLRHDLWEIANWANGSPFACPFSTRQVVAKRGMNLVLTVGPSASTQYACEAAEVRTNDFFEHGCYRAVLRPGRTAGVVSSMQAFSGALDNGGNGEHNEISIQFRGTDTTRLYLIIWTNGRLAGQHVVNLGFDATYEFHTYGFAWTAEGVDFVVDGRLVWRRPTGARVSASYVPTPSLSDAKLKAIFNTWAVDASAEKVAGFYQGQASTTEVAAFSYMPSSVACQHVL